MTHPAWPTSPADGRLVSNASAPRYLAYGETAETPARATRIVAKPSDDSSDLLPVSYQPAASQSLDGGTMTYTQTGSRR